MKAAAYMIVHYGREYIEYALRGVMDHVDTILILYTDKPSHGSNSNLVCPETREELKDICDKTTNKIKWVDVTVGTEGQHRSMPFSYFDSSYDVLAVVDSDEVWNSKAFKKALEYAANCDSTHIGANHQGWVTPWRSFNECVTDGFNPIRFHNLKSHNREQNFDCPCEIYHMGYAQSEAIMKYKLSCHGHKNEIPENWFEDKWLNYEKGKTTYLHPATDAYWIETKEFDKKLMPDFMKKHPYYNMKRIK